MNLVWAVVKGDLLTSACWFLIYALVIYVVARYKSRRAAPDSRPAWARRPMTPEGRWKLASMRRRRDRLRARCSGR